MSVGRNTAYIIVTSAGATYRTEMYLYACYLLGIAGALSRRGEGGEERKERKKEERKRRGQGGKREEEGKEKKKMSRESDHAPRLGKLVDSEVPSTEGRDY